MRAVKLVRLILLMLFVANSISCSTRCKHLIKYQTNEIDVKALKSKIGGKVDLDIGEFKIEHKFRSANDTLQKLDDLQYAICNQIKGLRKGEQKEKEKKKYIHYLELMMLSVMGLEAKVVEKEKVLEEREREESGLGNEKQVRQELGAKEINLSDVSRTYIDLESNLIIAWTPDDNFNYQELRITLPDGTKIIEGEEIKNGDHWVYRYRNKKHLIIVKNVNSATIKLLIKMK